MATMSLRFILEPCCYDKAVMNQISDYLKEKGYSYHKNKKSTEIIIEDCTKETGYNIIETAINDTRDRIKHGFQMVANKNNLYIRRKYKKKH